jgi:hypothetical protein
VHRANSHELIGLITVSDIVAAYRKAGSTEGQQKVPANLAPG